MIVELSHIDKTYNPKTFPVPVLKDVSLSVPENEYLAIMGPSGSGKSTLMNIIGCLDKPTGGSYLFQGEDIGKMSENRLSEFRAHKIGFVFQTFELLKEETAIQNVMLPLSFAEVRYSERREIAARALEKVGLGDRMNFLPSQLSGGQKQRVAIARAIVNNPALLLADEPTGALDQKSGAQIMELFHQLHEEGATIVMITHDAKIAAHAKKTIYIVDGEIRDHLEENE